MRYGNVSLITNEILPIYQNQKVRLVKLVMVKM